MMIDVMKSHSHGLKWYGALNIRSLRAVAYDSMSSMRRWNKLTIPVLLLLLVYSFSHSKCIGLYYSHALCCSRLPL